MNAISLWEVRALSKKKIRSEQCTKSKLFHMLQICLFCWELLRHPNALKFVTHHTLTHLFWQKTFFWIYLIFITFFYSLPGSSKPGSQNTPAENNRVLRDTIPTQYFFSEIWWNGWVHTIDGSGCKFWKFLLVTFVFRRQRIIVTNTTFGHK